MNLNGLKLSLYLNLRADTHFSVKITSYDFDTKVYEPMLLCHAIIPMELHDLERNLYEQSRTRTIYDQNHFFHLPFIYAKTTLVITLAW